jgi:DNA-binding IscR family transcriptional regulator
MLHVLLHMDRQEGPLTSETIAGMLATNPGVIRRTMAGLREAGYVASEKGHGGGWSLLKPLEALSLWGVYEALGEPQLFAIGPSPDADNCPLESAADDALEAGLSIARNAFAIYLKHVTLRKLVENAERSVRSAS